ncbi:unnamed protein product [Sympodiomycopsis kandeliae]
MPPRKRTNAAGGKADSSNGTASVKKGGVTSSPSSSSARKGTKAGLAAFAALCFLWIVYDQFGHVISQLAKSSAPSAKAPASKPASPSPQSEKDTLAKQKEAMEKYKEQMKKQWEEWEPVPSLPFFLPPRGPPAKPSRQADDEKRDAVKNAFKSSWKAYVDDAWGSDEYHPISHTGSNLSVDGGIGYMITDALHPLLLMGEQEEYNRARDWIKDNLAGGNEKWQRRGRYNVFETTIRNLGGLLSAHALCQEYPSNLGDVVSPAAHLCAEGDAAMYLETAKELANQLHPAFDTPTGVPKRDIDFYSGKAYVDEDNNGASSLAEATTIQLEFKYLSHLTNDSALWKLAERPMKTIRKATQGGVQDGLLPIFLNPESGQFYLAPIRLGSRGDSYYEYLIKQYVQTFRTEEVYRNMYDRAVAGIKKHLIKQSSFSKPPFLFTAEIIPQMQMQQQQRPAFRLLPKQDHLVCFLPGSMMLGAHDFGGSIKGWPQLSEQMEAEDRPTVREEDWTVGHELLRGCMTTYQETATGLSPEITHWRTMNEPQASEQDWYIKQASPDASGKQAPLIDARNILRPETVESLFVAFHLTGDPIYRQWGWEIFQAFEKHCKLSNGAYAGIKDVDAEEDAIEYEDKMETFWLSETLSYLYLLFEDQDKVPQLNQWVFNTEGHPLPIFVPSEPTSLE